MRSCGFMPPGRFCVLMGLLRVMLARSHSPVPLPAAFVSVTRQPTTETEVNMAIINLRDYYPFYTSDCFMEVSEEVAEMFKEFDRKEAAYGCVHTATKPTIPLIGMTGWSMKLSLLPYLPMNCMSGK